MGVHLSKVRSLALDFWNPEHVELMKCIGNERSWAIFEETYVEGNSAVADDVVQVKRPEEDSSQSVKEKWIVAKYVNRRFVKYPGPSDSSESDRTDLIREVN